MSRASRRVLGTLGIAVLVLGAAWVADIDTIDPNAPVSESQHTGTGYSRDLFGPAWVDVDHNGCDQRNDVLARDLIDVRLSDDGCTVLRGVLEDDLTGKTIQFARGRDTSSAVQIDHRLSLAAAYRMGADSWSAERRLMFANDASNLEAMDGPENARKSDSTPSEWLPPVESARCAYVTSWEATALKWELTVSAEDQAEIDSCNKE